MFEETKNEIKLSNKDVAPLALNSIDVHCHGVGRFDFTEINELRFQEIEDILSQRHHKSILTLYLPQTHFEDFLRMMDIFAEGYHGGKYPHITGIALEGPLLASHGGTPHKGVWLPTKREWIKLSECGSKGLVYIIWSPDADFDREEFEDLDSPATNVKWLAETMLKGGVLPAPGHFTKVDPEASAQALQQVFDAVEEWGKGPTLTDHLYNDMPHNFIHAWRTKEAKQRREKELKQIDLDSWSLANLDEKVGVVPATMIRNAKRGLVKLALNFDGEHVDLEVVKRTVELVGAENLLMMTDSIESKRLAGRQLYMKDDSSLLYQDEGIVAAGSQNVSKQIRNMLKIGLSKDEISIITEQVPTELLKRRYDAVKNAPEV